MSDQLDPRRVWKRRRRVQLLDVRDGQEFAATRVPGSRNLPLDRVVEATAALERSGLPVVFICRDGSHSARAADMLERRGRIPVAHLDGGLEAWLSEGLPVWHAPTT